MKAKVQQTQTVNPLLLTIPLLGLLVGLLAGAWPLLQERAVALPGHSAPTQQQQMETVYAPALSLASPSTTSSESLMLLPEEMPPLPDCSSLGVECDRWDVRLQNRGGDDVLDVKLKAGDDTIGHAQLMRVQTSQMDELYSLQRLGINEAWMGHIQVVKALRYNGLGAVMWKAGDAALRAASGGGVVRVVYDTVGWGERLMRHVPADWFIVKDAPMWVYVIP